MKKRLAVMILAACVAAGSMAGVSQSVNAAPRLKLASDQEEAADEEAEDTTGGTTADEEAGDTAEEATADEADSDAATGEEILEETEAVSSVEVMDGSTLTVSGSGTATISPDGAVLYVGVETTAESSREAQTENAEKINAVIEALTDAGVDEKDITTGSFDIYSIYDYSGDSTTPVGCRVSTMLTVGNLDIEEVGDLIDLAIDAGANDINGISYTYDDAEEAYDRALEAALQRANAKALLLAEAAGGQLGAVVCVVEEGASYGVVDARTYAVTESEQESDSTTAMTVMAGETEITATVSVTYLIEPVTEDAAAAQQEQDSSPDGTQDEASGEELHRPGAGPEKDREADEMDGEKAPEERPERTPQEDEEEDPEERPDAQPGDGAERVPEEDEEEAPEERPDARPQADPEKAPKGNEEEKHTGHPGSQRETGPEKSPEGDGEEEHEDRPDARPGNGEGRRRTTAVS